MKLKGINFFEQHVEKIVLGVCGAALAGAVGWQLFFAKSGIKVGKETNIAVSRAYEPAEREARTRLSALDAPNPELPNLPSINLQGSLALGANVNTLPPSRIALGRSPGYSGLSASAGVASQQQFSGITVPAPSAPIAASFRNTISPIEKLSNPELAKLLPAQQPYDKASVSIEAEFNGKTLRAALEADPDGDGPLAPLPPIWWKDAASGMGLIEIVGVEVERMTIRTPDGQTPAKDNVIMLSTPPGVLNVLQDWRTNVKRAGDVPGMLDEARISAEEVLRPAYYPTIAGPRWQPPSEMLEAMQPGQNPKEREMRLLRNTIKDIDRRIRAMDAAGGTGTPGAGRPQTGRDEGGGGGGRGAPGRGQPQPPPRGEQPDRNRESQVDPQQQMRQKARESLLKRRADVVARLRELGDKDADRESAAPATQAKYVHLLDNDKVKLWAHDVTVQPGATYAYRMRVVINNPLFDRAVRAEQQALATAPVIEGAWTEWTTPVDVDRDRYFFITSAVESAPDSGRPRASAEMFVFYYGYYRSGSASVELGDAMNAKASLPELRLADEDALATLVASNPAGLDNLVLDPIVRKDAEESTTTPTPGPRTPTGPGRGVERGAAAPETNPIMTRNAPREINLPVDAILLGVVPSSERSASGERRYEAVFRDQDGQLVSASPERARNSEVYKRVKFSGDLGKDQGKEPKPEAEVDLPPPPPPPRIPRPGSGGGGGGGGGG